MEVGVYNQVQVFQLLWLGQSLSGKKKTPKNQKNLGICSSELVKMLEAVERPLRDQTALCVL